MAIKLNTSAPSTRLADDVDAAQALVDRSLQESLEAIPKYAGISATECEVCDEEIPQGRRDAIPGCTLCIYCATRKEAGL